MVKEDEFVVKQGADRENRFFFSTGSVKLGHYCFSSSCCAGYADSALSKHYDMHDCRGRCGRIGKFIFCL